MSKDKLLNKRNQVGMTNRLQCAEVSSCPCEDIFFCVGFFTGKPEVKIFFFSAKQEANHSDISSFCVSSRKCLVNRIIH